MSAPTITPARPIRDTHLKVATHLLGQYRHLPAPTSIAVSTKDGMNVAVELTVDTVAQVDAWAEAMGVDVHSELHPDDTWTDRCDGMLRVALDYRDEHVTVHVYSPQAHADPRPMPHPHIDAKGVPRPCTHLELCAVDEAEFMGGDQ